ncbi:MAG: C39 family peptidase [bacterium]
MKFKKALVCLVMTWGIILGMINDAAVTQAKGYSTGTYQFYGETYIRSKPNKTSKKLGMFKKGKKLSVKKIVDSKWAVIQYKGKTAYVSLKFAKKIGSSGSSSDSSKSYKTGAYVLNSKMQLRTQPKKTSKQISMLPKDTVVYAKAVRNKKWAKVSYNGKSGYVWLGDSTAIKTQYKVSAPRVSQFKYGYPKGCEGVSLYQALRAQGYLKKNKSVKAFMKTMPRSKNNPNKGYVGNPSKGSGGVNKGKRTTINPKPLTRWANRYAKGHAANITGCSLSTLKKELRKGNPVVIWLVNGSSPRWKKYSFGWEVMNNHAVCLVGYNAKTNKFCVNDCGSHFGEHWISAGSFEKRFSAKKGGHQRRYAVVIR